VIRDQGVITIVMRILTKVRETPSSDRRVRLTHIDPRTFHSRRQFLDPVLFAEIVNRLGHLSGDFSAMDKSKAKAQ
jgi:hypothetical protein